jgi:RNA polymerase sigma factor (sigma-70 family)
MTDQDILKALRENKFSRAMKPLFKYRIVVLKMVMQGGGTKEDGEDIFQDALVILCRKVKQADFILSASLNTYLFGVSKNLWRDLLRKRNKTIPAEITEDLEEADQDFILTELKFQQAEHAFLLLGEKCKELLMQFYIQKKPMAQIASSLGFANERVAKNQKYRCIEKAKENFSQLNSEIK